ncbi:GNAT family N-acetyltransferase [Aneurinibacillus migulanus]|uniref:Acetyltransferase n=1 Tax=Aneurinibacillus migulanus TaxID=47500 RepID=A0A0D1Y0U9_ANEMI|nr:GNAT family N-acetyltransferase [Aneurinibacillus migulanus]KIV60091.1 acetyltransferase [Aneurinibacillus migulanus]KON96792.1 acetyltransferase [Aneurinibacillus migulanus]MED0893560.1 GNAT family N-acetyltransferase [Aneurinibacillus migulanus]MED1616338.1 GNAT family N-acetyltransferase [Aneurinibacillus migulanus]SDJ45390.1 Protein N-acetyltransferase, RimJ/RimL family [Aneurinibacillus migulanus]
MNLETKRLLLKTLDLDLIEAAAKRDTQAIEALGYKTNGEWPGPDFFEALPYFRELLIKNNGTKGFDSWIIVAKDTQEIVGGIGFLGDPDPDGIIEMGFATNESHRRKGYCFEAAQKLLQWAVNQDAVKCITARCEPDNIGSKNVLMKLEFQIDHRDAKLIYWKYRKAM